MEICRTDPLEHEFTEVIRSIADMPKMLYFRGKLPEKRGVAVAIVGSRKLTRYGESVAYELAYGLARRGCVVVSGLAYGVDAVAHRGCLDAGGVAVAVLATSVDRISPAGNVRLGREILDAGGAILSEYGSDFEGLMPMRARFVQRNRIVSGLADVVIVVEAAAGSGSLTTARFALEQGRELWAAPGDITRPMSAGCNDLIGSGRARCVMSVATTIEAICGGGGGGKKQMTLMLDEVERMAHDGLGKEEIIEKTGLDAGEVMRRMTLAELSR